MAIYRHKHRGLAELVWYVVEDFPMDRRFMAKDLVEFFDGVPVKSLGRALGHLCTQGRLVIADKVRDGGTAPLCVYCRAAVPRPRAGSKTDGMQPEHDGRVSRSATKHGTVRVSFGAAWRPFREPVTDRPWRGYESGLARIS